MKSKLISLLTCAVMVFISAGCAGNSDDTAPNAGGTTAVIGSAGDSTGDTGNEKTTRTVGTVKGEVEVPANPQRVVVDYLIGDVVAVGVVPIGTSKADYAGANTAFAAEIKGVAEIGWDMDPEAIMALEPDLILLCFSEKPYDDLSKIAPTVYVPYGDMSIEERIEFIGEALNRQEDARKVIAAYQESVQEGRQKLKDAGLSSATVTIGQFAEDASYIAGSKHAVGDFVYNELGLSAPQKVKSDIIDADEYWGNISLEVLGSYCGDYIITLGEIPEGLQSNTVWKLIPAVQSGNLISVDTAVSWYTDIMSANVLLDITVNGILALAGK